MDIDQSISFWNGSIQNRYLNKRKYSDKLSSIQKRKKIHYKDVSFTQLCDGFFYEEDMYGRVQSRSKRDLQVI